MTSQKIDKHRAVIVIDVGNGKSDPSSKLGRSFLHFLWERYESNYTPYSYVQIVEQTAFFSLGMAIALRDRKKNLWDTEDL